MRFQLTKNFDPNRFSSAAAGAAAAAAAARGASSSGAVVNDDVPPSDVFQLDCGLGTSLGLDVPTLEGKTAIVTGSTSGIGLNAAQQLVRNGCNVVVTGSRSVERVEELLAELSALHPKARVVYVQANLTDLPTATDAIVDRALAEFGVVDILVNNAGVQYVAPVEEFPVERWDMIMSVNLSAAWHLTRRVVKVMKEQPDRWGRIINISSVHGVVASVNKTAYCSAKHGLNGMTKVVALELADCSNITCNAICPGWVYTPLIERQIQLLAEKHNISRGDAVVKLVSAKQPRPKFTSCDQLSDLILFLCSESAANLTGAELVMDGGWTAQ